MEKRSSAFARISAAVALVAAVVVVIVAIAGSLGDSNSSDHRHQGTNSAHHRQRTEAKTYVVKSGDTLVSIAHRTGVPVAHIIALNPEVDPQILIAGETLKLR